MRSVERLREWARKLGKAGSDVLMFADMVEAEVAVRYMKLPVDAYSEPIHVGDEMFTPGGKQVMVVAVGAAGFVADDAPLLCAADCTHHKPTVEEVLSDYAAEVWNGRDDPETVRKYADMLREVMHDE